MGRMLKTVGMEVGYMRRGENGADEGDGGGFREMWGKRVSFRKSHLFLFCFSLL